MWLRSYVAVAVAIAPIQPLAWEPSYAAGAALKMKKKKIRIWLQDNGYNCPEERASKANRLHTDMQ